MNKIQTPGRHPLSIPVKGGQPIEGVRLVGNQPGKTLVVTAGVHGDEYVGIQAVRELLAQLSPGELSGQVIFVPVVNAGGFFAGTYRVPEDGENLNRCFPGAKGETYTWNMASALEAALYHQADFLLDLHGGGIYETMEPLAFFPVDAGERVKSVARQAGQALSLTFLVQSFARDGLYSWAAQQGIPGLLVERGSGGTWSRAEVDACKENILQLLDFLEIRPYGSRKGTPREVEDAHYETVQANGYWYPEKQPGDTFAQGELLGRVESGEGETLQAITAPFDGVVLYQTHILGVSQGMPLLAYGKLRAEGGLSRQETERML